MLAVSWCVVMFWFLESFLFLMSHLHKACSSMSLVCVGMFLYLAGDHIFPQGLGYVAVLTLLDVCLFCLFVFLQKKKYLNFE